MADRIPPDVHPRNDARLWAMAFARPWPHAFYGRATVTVARELLGGYVIHRTGSGFRVVRLVEVEAYVDDDPASHAFRGPTQRNRSMFLGPGTLYVFRIHQVYCANAVTLPGQAVLLRGAGPVVPMEENPSGPGRLARALDIRREHDGFDLASSEVRIVPGAPHGARVIAGPRVGIREAAERPLRFSLAGSRWVSSPRPLAQGGSGA